MSKKNTKQIVSMLAAETKITLYTAEGEVLELKKNGPHDTSKLAEKLVKDLNGISVVEIDLNDYLTMNRAIVPEGYESTGIVVTQVVDGKTVQGIFYPSSMQVAVQHEGEEVIIPKIEHLEKHANRANAENSPAVRNFLRRLAPVVKDRKHSAEDLMDFIKRSDLPLTNDGLIIGYKKVNQADNGKFVDVHSGKIEQQVGSHVWMDVDAVDPDRNRSCSHGLHVANLGYLRGFGGTHTLIVLVDPANFIAVPHNETNKCRVCAYDVIGVMSASSHRLVNSGNFVTEDRTFKSVIQDAVAGRAAVPFEAVKVGTKEVLEVVPINGNSIIPFGLEEANEKTMESSGESLSKDPEVQKAEQKDLVKLASGASKDRWKNVPKEVMAVFKDLYKEVGSKTAIAALHGTSTRTIGRWEEKYDYAGWVQTQKAPVPEEVVQSIVNNKELSVAERAREMFKQGAYETLIAFKKAKKKSFNALGFTFAEEEKILKEADK